MRRRLKLGLAGAILAGLSGHALADESGLTARQLAAVERAVAKYRDAGVARADGWRRTARHAPLMGEHWGNRSAPDYIGGGPIDFTRPSNLIYAEIGGTRELLGVAYIVRLRPGEPLPEGFAGSADRWHVHDLERILAAVGETRPVVARLGRSVINRRLAADGRTRLAMVHVWLGGGNADGAFENRSRALPYRRLGLGPDYASSASWDAAFGAALAHPEGCRNELEGKLKLAGAPRATRRDLMRTCAAAAARIREALDTSPARFNAISAAEWRRFDRLRTARLTARERARIGALVE